MDTFQSEVDTIAQHCIASRLRVLNRIVTNIYDEALRPFGLKVSQHNILVAVAKMGTAQPSVLSEIIHIDISTLSRNVDRMRQRGWLTASPGEDGRTVMLSLTQQGEELLHSVMPAWRKAQEQATELMGQEEVSRLYELTRSLDRIEREA